MLIFPYSTDAPVYHWPHATVWLIVVNCVIWFSVPVTAVIAPDSPWLLAYGDGIHVDQWFGSRFMHDGFGHLFGNMVFLWIFGLVVEGKLGWFRFLAIYLLIAIGQAGIEQLAMLGYGGVVPGSLGASAAIYGIMAIAAVWAPANSVSFFYWFVIFIGTFEAPISAVAAFYIGMDLFLAGLFGGHAGSSVLHVMGAAVGFPLGVLLLKRGAVDCEGWDLFTRSGWGKNKEKKEREAEDLRKQLEAEQRERRILNDSSEAMQELLRAGKAGAALKLYRKMKKVGAGLSLDTPQMASLVEGLHAEKHWVESAPFMAELIERAPDHADPVRVKLAQICVAALNRPGRALDLLSATDAKKLNGPQRQLAQKIADKANAMQADGFVELDDGGWGVLSE